MGIPRPPDPYGLTTAPAWPEVDEDTMSARARAFEDVSEKVGMKLEGVKRERSQLFGGVGLWSGSASIAASKSLDKRIVDLETTKEQLNTAADAFATSVSATVSAKHQIISAVEIANKLLDWIRTHPEIPEDAKSSALSQGIAAVRAENISVVASAASKISGLPAKQFSPETPLSTSEDVRPTDQADDGSRIVLASNEMLPGGTSATVTPAAPGTFVPDSHKNTEALGGSYEAPAPPAAVHEPLPAKNLVNTEAPGGAPGPETPPGRPVEGTPPPGSPAGRGAPVMPSLSGTPGSPSAPRISAPTSPLSGTQGPSVSAPSTSNSPSAANHAAAVANQAQISEIPRSMVDAAAKTAAQTPIPPPQATPSSMGAAPAAQPLPAPPVPDAPTSTTTPTPPPAPTSPASAGAGVTAPAPVTPAPGSGAAPGGAVPLGPPPTPPPAAPATPATAGPSVAPAAAAAGSSTVGAPAPVPVSAARAQREAIAAATLRRPSATDPVQVAHRIAAALNVGINDIGFFWITGLAKDGTIVVANNYGLGYIPEGVNLPDPVKMASADESIPATIRGTWATYPILALHGWAQHHNTELRAVIATEDQFKGFDPGAPKIVLRPDDIPQSGEMKGRRRLQVIAADAATRLAAISGGGLSDVLPPAPTDTEAPQDQRAELWFEVFRPLLSNAPDRGQVQLAAFVTYAEHAQELALHDAHIATDEASQRAAIADWIYWQHLSVLSADAIAASASV